MCFHTDGYVPAVHSSGGVLRIIVDSLSLIKAPALRRLLTRIWVSKQLPRTVSICRLRKMARCSLPISRLHQP
ncbi:hypothetical protein HYQ46_012885 [Verticillium longisporum]|nr:hypothetical protein HYQ44_008546 [Verticillium longisporum]KAG7151345.1 hypothetical protein HYQ46_012885 [Verticillium longisporum]